MCTPCTLVAVVRSDVQLQSSLLEGAALGAPPRVAGGLLSIVVNAEIYLYQELPMRGGSPL